MNANAQTSGRKLAAALGVSQKTIREYLARPDWPVRRSAPWTAADVAAARAWRSSLQEDRAAEASAAAEAGGAAQRVNTGLKMERLLHERVKRLQREGKLVDRELLDVGLTALARLFVTSVEALTTSLPVQLVEIAGVPAERRHLVAAEFERELRLAFNSVRRDLAARQTIEVQTAAVKLYAMSKPQARGRPALER